MYEPPQKQQQQQQQPGGGGTYDSSALTEAARVAVAAAAAAQDENGGGGGVGSETCEEMGGAAASEVGRAVRVAQLLGLRLVGWCLSHDKVRERTKPGSGRDKQSREGSTERGPAEGQKGGGNGNLVLRHTCGRVAPLCVWLHERGDRPALTSRVVAVCVALLLWQGKWWGEDRSAPSSILLLVSFVFDRHLECDLRVLRYPPCLMS